MESRLRSAAAFAVLGLVGLALIAGCGGDPSATVNTERATAGSPLPPEQEEPLSAAEQHGRDLFVQHCGSCHTLGSAGTVGQIGPDLDNIPVTEGSVLRAIRIGGGRHTRGNQPGPSGNMPRNLVTGKDARDVAKFVSATASNPSAPG